MMHILNRLALTFAAFILIATTPSSFAAIAAGAGIEINGKYVGGYTITWNGESREVLVRQLLKRPITFERNFKIPVDKESPTSVTLKGKIRILSKIRGDKEIMATTTVLKLVKREGKWYAEPKSFQQALKKVKKD